MSYYPCSWQFGGPQLIAQHKVIFALLDQLDLRKIKELGNLSVSGSKQRFQSMILHSPDQPRSLREIIVKQVGWLTAGRAYCDNQLTHCSCCFIHFAPL